MNKIIDENTRCQYCNCKLMVTPKDIGQPAICVDCQKTKTKCTIVLVIIAIVIYFILAFISFSLAIASKASYAIFPGLPILVIIAFCLRNTVTNIIIEKKSNK